MIALESIPGGTIAAQAPEKSLSPKSWPKGKKQKLTYKLGERLFNLIATSEKSLFNLLHEYQDLPPFRDLVRWRRKKPWFNEAWRAAREAQGEFLAQRCLDIAEATTPKNAHAQRLKFDIYFKLAGKLNPSTYGDQSNKQSSTNTSVNVAIAISPERLNEIRSKLDQTRDAWTLGQSRKLKEHAENSPPKRTLQS